MNKKARTRLMVATSVLLAVMIVGIGYSVWKSSASYYHVGQLTAAMNGKQVKVSGRVVDGTIVRDAAGVHFAMQEDRAVSGPSPTVKVDYSGQMPASFNGQSLVIVVGTYDGGLIAAKQLQTKCPSKYQTQAATPAPAATQ